MTENCVETRPSRETHSSGVLLEGRGTPNTREHFPSGKQGEHRRQREVSEQQIRVRFRGGVSKRTSEQIPKAEDHLVRSWLSTSTSVSIAQLRDLG